MKRTISTIIIAAMLLSLSCVFAFAQTSISVDFPVPNVGDAMTASSTVVSTEPSVVCNIKSVYTDNDITAILNAKSNNNTTALESYTSASVFPTTAYENKPYLVVLSLYSAEIALSTSTSITSNTGLSDCGVLCDANYSTGHCIYAYLIFTPTATSSSDNNETDPSDETTTLPYEANQEVSVYYDESVTTKTVYSFEVTWGAMDFTYTPATEGTWNPATHKYETPTEAGWSSTTNEITIENHSNTEITATFTYTAESNFSGITGTFVDKNNNPCTDGKVAVESAVDSAADSAPSASVFLNLFGSLSKDTIDGTKSGTVTITIQ